MNTYTEQLSDDDWTELIAKIWQFGGRTTDNFKYDLPYPLPCRIIYLFAPNTNHYIEASFNENKTPHSFDNNPAIIFEWILIRSKYYMSDGQLHNTTGPAFIGRNYNTYALNGIIYKTFNEWISKLHNYVSNEDVLAIKLKGEQ